MRAAGRGKIHIGAKKTASSVYLTIYDNGIGISAINQKKLFEPFFSKSKLGAGLGLAFSKLAIKNMNGTIKFESKEGEFTRFTIELCMASHAPRRINPNSAHSHPHFSNGDAQSTRVDLTKSCDPS